MFSGHPDFKSVMGRNRFEKIRACLNLKLEGVVGDRFSTIDPLHSARRLLDEVSKFFCKVAVPTGTSALDEASCRSKARNRAISYLPSKPDKFAIRFYCVVGKISFTRTFCIEQKTNKFISFYKALMGRTFIAYLTMAVDTWRQHPTLSDIIIYIKFSDRYSAS